MATVQDDRRPVFPTIEARNLEGKNLTVPADLEGEQNVVLVAFQQWHQQLVDSWMPWLTQLAARQTALRVYEMPMLSRMYTLARPFIDGGMAAAIRSKQVREQTLTVYTDIGRVTGLLQIENTQDITLLLVARNGSIVWRGRGGYDAQQAVALEQAVLSLASLTST
jgi:hypothetical protein